MPKSKELVDRAEALGLDSVWVGEGYGRDALSALGYLAATTQTVRLGSSILQIDARTPAMAGMSAASLDEMSGGRLCLGFGVSGPQVVEGWHGAPFARPLARTRDYVTVVRRVIERAGPVRHSGEFFPLPLPGSTWAKPLQLSFRPLRPRIPIFLAAIGPRNVALAAEIADGWMPIFFAPAHADSLCAPIRPRLAAQARVAGSRAFEIVAATHLVTGPSLGACRDMLRPHLALYIGGMGAPGRNFYFDMACRYGYRVAAETISRLFQAGDRAGAAAAVPDALVDETMLVGSKEHIRDQLSQWQDSPVTTLVLTVSDTDDLDLACSLL